MLLQRNGLRVASGKSDSWPTIESILNQQPKVETSQSSLMINNGLPFILERW